MTQVFSLLCSLFMVFHLSACSVEGAKISENEQPTHSLSVESSLSSAPKDDINSNEVDSDEQIQITTEQNNVIIFQLNNSMAAQSLYSQLPLSALVDNYENNEKIFYLPNKLDVSNTPLAEGPIGTLAYYEPWGNVAIYYGEWEGGDGLYELGNIISGAEYISEITGEIYIDVVGTVSSKPANTESTSKSPVAQSSNMPKTQPKDVESVKNIQVTVGNKTFTATLAENKATKAFTELMIEAPIVVNMRDYSGFEKIGTLDTSLPTSNINITAQSGDIILYNGNQIVLFYGSNSWSYTRLGKIDDLSGWEQALGDGDVTVTFSI